MQEAQISDFDDEFDGASLPAHARCTWPFVIDAIIRHFPAVEVLQEVHD